MSSGLRAGLEIRETVRVSLPSYRGRPITTWFDVVPWVNIDWIENRTLFGVLAGYPSRLGIEPLIPPRGLPEDVSPTIRQRYDEWNGLAFDASWVTMDELVMMVERLTTALEARAEGAGLEELRKLHLNISIDAVIAFLTVYQERGFYPQMVFWSTPI